MAINRLYGATGLIGGITGDLDTIDGADLANNDMALVYNSGTVYFYLMNTAGAAAENSPLVILPDLNNDGGNKNWELQSIYVNDITIADDVILVADDVKVGGTLEVVGSGQFGDADGTGASVTFYSDTAGDHIVFDKTGKTFTLTDIQLVAGDVDINGGAIDGATLGAASAVGITDATFTELESTNTGKLSWGDGIPTADTDARGEIISVDVDQNTVGIGGVLVCSSDGSFDDADKDTFATVGFLVMATESGTGTKNVMLRGFMKDTAWSWTPGSQLYVGDSGAVTATLPTTGEFVQVVGYALSATVIYFNPSKDILELA